MTNSQTIPLKGNKAANPRTQKNLVNRTSSPFCLQNSRGFWRELSEDYPHSFILNTRGLQNQMYFIQKQMSNTLVFPLELSKFSFKAGMSPCKGVWTSKNMYMTSGTLPLPSPRGVHCNRISTFLVVLRVRTRFQALYITVTTSGSRCGLPWWLSGKESACNAGDPGSIPGSERFRRGGHGNPLHYVCLENPTDMGAWHATVHEGAKSRT